MKKLLTLFIIILSTCLSLRSQDKRGTICSGVGYYLDTSGMVDGAIFWLEAGYKLKTGFYLNTRLSNAHICWEMSQGPFRGYRTIALRQMADIIFSIPIQISVAHFLEPGIGFKLKREFSLYPDFYFDNSSGSVILLTRYSDVFYEIGFTLCVDYTYHLANNLYLGIRTDTNLIWAVGLEGLTISPIFGFKF